jgi:hypothetical protein
VSWSPSTEVVASEEGLREAVGRLDAALRDTAKSPYVPLAEVLEWVYRLDQWHMNRGGLGKDTYLRLRASSVEGKIHGALTLVRGIGIHHLVENAAPADLYLSETLRVSDRLYLGHAWRWRRLADLPSPEQPQHGRDDWYRNHVEQLTVMPPVEAATEFLLAEMHRHY